MVEITAAHAIVDTLIAAGVEHIFGLPTNHPLYQALLDRRNQIKHVLTRHEEGAAFMAYAYSILTKKIGVVEAAQGPGACHLVNAVAEANIDFVPLLALTAASWKRMPRIYDYNAIFDSITKLNEPLFESKRAALQTQNAIRAAITNPPGAVHMDIHKNILSEKNEYKILKVDKYTASNRVLGDEEAVEIATKLLMEADRPVMIVGWGGIISDASPEVINLSEILGMPVITAEKGKGIIPEDHPLSAMTWVADNHLGCKPAQTILKNADVILIVGTELCGPSPMWQKLTSPNAKLIEIDINPCRIAYDYPIDIGIVGDAKSVLLQIIKKYKSKGVLKNEFLDLPIVKELSKLKEEWWNELMPQMNSNAVPINPMRVVKEIQDVLIEPYNKLGKNTIITNGGGNHGIFIHWILKAYEPRTWIHVLHHGTIGAGLPYALGAKIALRDVLKEERYVVDIDGDGSFNMSFTAMGTATQHKIPIIVCLFNNESYGMVRDTQVIYYKGRVFDTEFSNYDYVKLAESFKWYGERVEKPNNIKDALQNAIRANDRGQPALIDFVVDKEVHTTDEDFYQKWRKY